MAEQSDQPSQVTPLETIDRAMLTPLVRRALNSDSCEIADWDVRPIHGGAGDAGAGTSGIYRIVGTGHDNGEAVSWSLILKVIGSAAQGTDPQAGARERLVYQSEVLNTFSGNLVAPRCFEVLEQPNGAYWLWLEDVRDESERPWPLQHYSLTARHLGQFNGSYLMGEALPSWPWLSRDWLRTIIAPAESAVPRLSEALDHPLASRMYPADVVAGLSRLWTERETLLAALDRMPQTVCHRDAWPRNLFLRRNGTNRDQTVAIDWAFVGLGAIGEELGPLIMASLGFFEIKFTNAQILDSLAFDSYLEGLHDAGWRGSPRVVRFGYTAAVSLRYSFSVMPILLDLTLNVDEGKRAWVEQVFGCSIETKADHDGAFHRLLVERGDEALALLDFVG